jgi:hypothetical protein
MQYSRLMDLLLPVEAAFPNSIAQNMAIIGVIDMLW